MPQFLEFERKQRSLLGATLTLPRPLEENRGDGDAASGARYGLFVAPQRGMASLVEEIAARLPPGTIHLNKPVTTVTKQNDGQWLLDFENTPSETNSPAATAGRQSAFHGLIFAVPAYAAAKALRSLDRPLAAELADIEYAGCAVVSLGFARRQIAHPLNGFGFVVPQIERRRIIAASFASLKFPGRAKSGDVLIRVFIGGALQPELIELPNADLCRIALEDLTELLRIEGEPLTADVARWPRSMPQYHLGHLDRIARIEQLAARYPTLALAGNAYHGVGIPQCIASGQSAAQQIAAALLV